ncbi:MAG: FumA C-terminus/TtdB family hydratase beta subunit [Bacillota bacterium]
MTHHLTPPLDNETIKRLKAGDKVLLSGTIYTARDAAHSRLVNDEDLPFPLEGAVIYYVGPTPAKEGAVIGAAGPTSSYRMDEMAVPLMKRGVKMMIGKGDRSETFRQEMMANHAVYMIATGGAGALLASKIKSRTLLMYEDLGPEAVYQLEVEDFPCFVAYDVHGNNLLKRSRT